MRHLRRFPALALLALGASFALGAALPPDAGAQGRAPGISIQLRSFEPPTVNPGDLVHVVAAITGQVSGDVTVSTQPRYLESNLFLNQEGLYEGWVNAPPNPRPRSLKTKIVIRVARPGQSPVAKSFRGPTVLSLSAGGGDGPPPPPPGF